ncbi:THAP domain-containing protein 1-like [Linepithema humile]|uniref:THAP domain-containing protein 1-like n=1 Tax=Linepithema humile TaxID=83485 RepID=UPI00062352CB|nr:PREDICTED: THAP domain-containing protein 1-like [Linepithema humile]
MVRFCCVEGCKTTWRPDIDLSFFSFPLKNEDLLKKWLQVIPTNNRITKHSRICSNHFEESQYDCVSGKRYLKKEAIPNRFPRDTIENKETSMNDEIPVQECQHDTSEDVNIDHCNDFVDYNTQPSKMFLSIVPLSSLPTPIDEATQSTPQTQNVATQMSPRRLAPSEAEEKLRRQVKILQKKLHRRERRILSIRQLLKHLKTKSVEKSSYHLDHLYAKKNV